MLPMFEPTAHKKTTTTSTSNPPAKLQQVIRRFTRVLNPFTCLPNIMGNNTSKPLLPTTNPALRKPSLKRVASQPLLARKRSQRTALPSHPFKAALSASSDSPLRNTAMDTTATDFTRDLRRKGSSDKEVEAALADAISSVVLDATDCEEEETSVSLSVSSTSSSASSSPSTPRRRLRARPSLSLVVKESRRSKKSKITTPQPISEEEYHNVDNFTHKHASRRSRKRSHPKQFRCQRCERVFKQYLDARMHFFCITPEQMEVQVRAARRELMDQR